MELGLGSWADFKSICITNKNLNCQYVDIGSTYRLIGPDANGINWVLELSKKLQNGDDNPDVDDFIDNHSASFNWAIGSRPYAFATGDFEFIPSSSSDVCTAGGSKSTLFKIEEKLYVNGGRLVTDGNSVYGDWIDFQIVDHDNLLGYGVDFVLKTWVPKWMVNWKSASETIQTPYAGCPPVGMYMRMTYHSTGGTDVGFAVNYLLHRPL